MIAHQHYTYMLKIGLGSFQIICWNLREFKQVIARDYLWDPPDKIKIRLHNHLSDQVGLISVI
jgi:hypothetical protein